MQPTLEHVLIYLFRTTPLHRQNGKAYKAVPFIPIVSIIFQIKAYTHLTVQ